MISGKVPTEKRLDMSAMAAHGFVSFPTDAGKITVFNPRGSARNSVMIAMCSAGMPAKIKTLRHINGITRAAAGQEYRHTQRLRHRKRTLKTS